MNSCDALIKAIDAYITKADDDLADILDKAGFAEPNDTVKEISSMEEKTAEILEAQTVAFDKKLKKLKRSEEIAAMAEEFEAEDLTADEISEIYREEFNTIIPKLSNVYLKKMDNELVIEKIRNRTSAWVDDFSAKLGSWIGEHLMSSIKPVLFYGVQSGESIVEITARIYGKNYHEHYYQARRIAITEVLRAHSVAQQEAIIQNPAVDYKEWRHTGSHKNNPRKNHVGMDGVKALKDESFNLLGADGKSHAPMFPRDPELPASESVNCHCIHRGIVNENVLGLPLEERKRLQDETVEADDKKFSEMVSSDAKSDITVPGINVPGNDKKVFTNPENSGIMDSGGEKMQDYKVDTGGLRNEKPLTQQQIDDAVDYAMKLNMPSEQIRYGEHYVISYGANFDMLYLGTDTYPAENPSQDTKSANSRISWKAAIAHELVGHREAALRGRTQPDKLFEEAQASIRAARFAPDLSESERITLLRDAVYRLNRNLHSGDNCYILLI